MDQLRDIIARLTDTDAADITPTFSLNHRALQGSAGRARLDAMIRSKLQTKCAAVYTAKTFSELESAVTGNAIAAPSVAPPDRKATGDGPVLPDGPPGVHGTLSVGIDLELIDSMPESADFWNTPFYTQFFSPREIAYCVSQPSPREHFAARWCAKEALKKADPAHFTREPHTIETLLEDTGRPYLRIEHNKDWHRIPHAVSLSHTPLFATAIVITAKS